MTSTPAGPVLTASRGPEHPMASQAHSGLVPGITWRYRQQPGGGSTRLARGFDVQRGTVWALAVFPDLEHDPTSNSSPDPNFDGCRLGVEFVTDRGVVTLVDQHGHPADGSRQCLVAGNWNLLELDLSPLAGRRVHEVRLASPARLTGAGWVQAVGVRPRRVEADEVTDRVDTRRGTHSAFLYSRGNTLPAACTPHGANFLTPLTGARDRSWLYGWHRDGGATPHLEGFALSHCPSPWITERTTFQLMPWQGEPDITPKRRRRTFRHEDEVARAHRYEVLLDGGIHVAMAPTSHAAVLRLRFDQAGPHGVLLDMPEEGAVHWEQLPDGRLAFRAAIAPDAGWVAPPRNPQPPAYVYGETSVAASAERPREWRSPLEGIRVAGRRLVKSPLGLLRAPLHRPQAAVVHTEAQDFEVRMGLSFLGVEQARRNLRQEVGDWGLDEVAEAARAQWQELLARLEVDGGTLDQRTSAWSNLARLYSWPNAHHEDVGTPELPRRAYASPYHPVEHKHSPERTGCRVVEGELYVNNGYWDTFRTCWPLYSLLTPRHAAGLLDGILQQYRDGGWMARWAAPGYVDCMPGTSSDVVFAAASLAGTLDDELTAYDSALRNATVPSADPSTGRKGIGHGRFVGWIDTDTQEGLAWSVDSAMEDAAISLWSGRLAERARVGEPGLVGRRDEFEANAAWFANRALSHQAMFDARVGFHQGRLPEGSFRFPPGEFDPRVWGRDFTETDAWGQAFHAPHDGAGLAVLMGGEQALEDKLDALLATRAVTRPAMWGGYDYNTQEMNEAEADGIGQLAISNQPAHHIPFMYLCCGRPWKTQWLTRELLDKKFVGSEIGQGYPGDEDNGEMSGYWLCLALGLFPLFPGSGEWAITAPLFERMAFRRDDQTSLEVRATGVEHRYIQSVRLNGRPWDSVVLGVDELRGDVLLEVELGPEPSDWGSGSRPFSSSTSGATPMSTWQPDRTHEARLEGDPRLVDDRGTAAVSLAAGAVVELTWPEPFRPLCLTLTSPDPHALPLHVSVRRGGEWTDAGLAPREPLWADQTVAHLLPDGQVDGLRLVAADDCVLSQVEVY